MLTLPHSSTPEPHRHAYLHAALIGSVAVALRCFEGTSNLSYVLVALYALGGTPHSIRALFLSWLFTMMNPGIAPAASLAFAGRYLILGAAAFSVFVRSGRCTIAASSRRALAVTILLAIFITIHSLLLSPDTRISLLKSGTWATAYCTLLLAWARLPAEQYRRVGNELIGGLILILLFSLPLTVTRLGYLRNGVGFQGILNHPQAFGATVALLGVWVFCVTLTSVQVAWRRVALVGLCFWLILLSTSRTSGLAICLTVLVTTLLAPIVTQGPRRKPLWTRSFWCGFAALAMLSVLAMSTANDKVSMFIAKGSSADSLSEAYELSRGGLVSRMWENIQQDVFGGVGFGIASRPEFTSTERGWLELPVTASVEKGVFFVAVLEELGIFGLSVTLIWISTLVSYSISRNGVVGLGVCSVVLLVNLGESTLFSVGGLGLLLALFMTWATTAPTELSATKALRSSTASQRRLGARTQSRR